MNRKNQKTLCCRVWCGLSSFVVAWWGVVWFSVVCCSVVGCGVVWTEMWSGMMKSGDVLCNGCSYVSEFGGDSGR